MPKIKNLLLTASVLISTTIFLLHTNTFQSKAETQEQSIVNAYQSTENTEKKDTYVPGQILVKLKQPIEEVAVLTSKNPNPKSTEVAFEGINKSNIPQKLIETNEKYPIITIAKVIPQAESPDKEFAKLKAKFKDMDAETAATKEEKIKSIDLSTLYKITLASDAPVEEIIKELSTDPNVDYAEPNYYMELAVNINDPYYPSTSTTIGQWWLENPGLYGNSTFGYSRPDADIDAIKAWNVTRGASTTVIAIIDSGIYYTHPDLGGGIGPTKKVIGGYDYVNNDTNPMDDAGHGTHVAGIIGADIHNHVGVAGVCPSCKLMALKVFPASGFADISDIIAAIYYAIDNGANIVNMSFGNNVYTEAVDDATSYGYVSGVLMVAAAGNRGISTKFYPAANTGVIAVAGTDYSDELWDLSDYDDGSGWVDISAPAVDILSTALPGGVCSDNFDIPNTSYGYCTGTSMASPIVAGIAGLLQSEYPFPYGWTPALMNQLLASTDNIDAYNPGFVGKMGSGRIDANKALTVLDTNLGFKWCADTDWGDVANTKGNTTGNGTGCTSTATWDACTNASTLSEKRCGTGNICFSTAHTCANGCSNGRCL